ncbi:hypothetical protein J2Z83_001358 [Virgibacillus natechei]|uniref:Heparinase II/III-like protein n=1 Tax=Virgibacillus natechei TaxID=1216297 RepID=A0ABS4IE97_9BACI|nr:heparinase II/III family protein [Virgibacillus natechei]MBP1969254.1 hypothetical protein [Virgibacillus natechei]UZD12412.1 heparinase II/III family protein [Virgibacillus natechei]
MNQIEIQTILENSDQCNRSLLFTTKQEQYDWLEKLNTQTQYKQQVDEIREEAKRLLEEPQETLSYSLFKLFHETGSRKEYEEVYFAKRRRLNTFTLMSVLEKDNPSYLEEFENIIWSICNEYTWCLPAHLNDDNETSYHRPFPFQEKTTHHTIDLFAAETGFTLSEILRLTEDLLDPLLKKRIHQEIDQRIMVPYRTTTFHWETATHNWAAVCAGSIGAIALHLFEDNKELSIVIERVLRTMNYYLDGFTHDGTCLEGYGYWQYGFGYYVYFSDLLKKRTDGNINTFDLEKVHQIALFQQKIFLNKERVVNFSDASPTATIPLGLSHYLAHMYNDFETPEYELRAYYKEDHTSRWAPAFRNLLWFDPELAGRPWSNATYYLNESQWLISRHLTEKGHPYVFAAKGGHNDEPHNHNDIGHFLLYGGNEIFLKDLGNGLYNKDYFASNRYSFVGNGSQGHSVPIINHHYQRDGSSHYSTVENVTLNEREERFCIDMTKGYAVESLHQLAREYRWKKTNEPTLTLLDTYIFDDQPESIIERIIIPPLLIKEEPGFLLLEGSSKLKIKFDQEKLQLKINKFEFTNHFGEVENNIALDFLVRKPEKNMHVQLDFEFE